MKTEYYIQYYDKDFDVITETYRNDWMFFTDNNHRVYKFDSRPHAENQIEYLVKSTGNLTPAYWIDETYATRIIKAEIE